MVKSLSPPMEHTGQGAYQCSPEPRWQRSDIRLFDAVDKDGELYIFEKSNVTFTKGKYYRVKVKMSLCTKFPLSQITHEDTQFKGWYIGSIISDGDTENCAYNSGGSGVNAVIAYVGKVPGYFDNFLAMVCTTVR